MEAGGYSFTQPFCRDCYEERYPDKTPIMFPNAEHEMCCVCGKGTYDGIFVRVDPDSVLYPSR